MIQRRTLLRHGLLGAAAPALASLSACGGGTSVNGSNSPSPTPEPPATRTWRMGFSGNPSRPDAVTLLRGVDVWSQRAELAIIHEELPWTELLRGTSADAILDRDKLPLVQYYRNKGLQVAFMGELNDGMARQREAPQLLQAGRSITDPAVQRLYRDYMLAVARKLRPDYLGLAAETNLVRAIAPAPLYAAVVQAANACATDLRNAGVSAPLLCSVQVETAWGKLGVSGPYAGIATDLRDFAFMQRVGLSSYPYFAWAQPEDLPVDYYSRPLASVKLPAMVLEGGWSSASFGTVSSTPEAQARYQRVHARLLDSIHAQGLIQLMFADLDLSAWPQPQPESLPLFAHIGLTDSNLAPKPALAEWDALFARRLVV